VTSSPHPPRNTDPFRNREVLREHEDTPDESETPPKSLVPRIRAPGSQLTTDGASTTAERFRSNIGFWACPLAPRGVRVVRRADRGVRVGLGGEMLGMSRSLGRDVRRPLHAVLSRCEARQVGDSLPSECAGASRRAIFAWPAHRTAGRIDGARIRDVQSTASVRAK